MNSIEKLNIALAPLDIFLFFLALFTPEIPNIFCAVSAFAFVCKLPAINKLVKGMIE